MEDVTITVSSPAGATGVLNSSAAPEMRNVHIDVEAAVGAGRRAKGVDNQNNAAPSLTNVVISARGGSQNYGILNANSSVDLDNVMVSATSDDAYAIYSVAANSAAPTVTIRDSTLEGQTNSVYSAPGTSTRIGASQLNGPTLGNLTCVMVYNESFTPLNASCQ